MFPLFKLAERNAVMTGLEGCSSGTTGEYCTKKEKRYASDEKADLVLSYFARKADYCNICYDAVCDTLDDAIAWDFSILFLLSNALDNAVDAASRCQGEKRFARVQFKLKKGRIFCRIENGFEGELKYDKEGRLISQKSDCGEYGLWYMGMEYAVKEKGTSQK